jgi:25S rRNA (adenine2142-N1)-methyltransferase
MVEKEGLVKKAKSNSNSKRVPLRRPRGKRGGIKNRKDKSSASASTKAGENQKNAKSNSNKATSTAIHATQIALFHTLEKQLAQTEDEKERRKIIEQQKSLGGLQAYQDASLFGGDKQRGGETGKWCAQQLMEIRGKEKVGSECIHTL